MSKFVLIVNLEIKPEYPDEFLEAAKEQLEKSISLEPGCHRFDVVNKIGERHLVTHYEIFEDEQAFHDHAAMPHTAAFSKRIEPMVVKVDMRQGQLEMSAGR